MSQDLEDQENELIVLESILSDHEQFIYNRHSDSLPSGQIQVDIELPKEFSISVKSQNVTPPSPEDNLVNNVITDDDHPQDNVLPLFVPPPVVHPEVRTAEVSYLPPITLLFTMPSNYPSTDPPLYTLQSNWLDRHTLSQLCQSLDCIWVKNQGTVVLFSWITFLRQETLRIIGCDKQFEVSLHSRKIKHGGTGILKEIANGGENKAENSKECSSSRLQHRNPTTTAPITRHRLRSHTHHHHRHLHTEGPPLDQRAVFVNSILRDKEGLFKFLIEYNKEREEIEFQRQIHACLVCFTDKVGTDFIRLHGCGHFFCKECMSACYKTHIKEGGIYSVKCLAVECSSMPSSAQVHELVGQELFERYDGMLLQRALEGMSDMIYCPRAKCGKPVIVEADEKLAWCSHCLYRFCAICKMVFHGVEPCRFKSDEKQKLFDSYTAASKEEQSIMERTYGKKQLALLVESTLSEKYIEKESKPCPHCKIPIEKFEGCNKVTCTKCGAYFCWMCSKQLDKGNPYFHYQDELSPCFNQLFENVGREFDSDDEDFEFSDEEDDDEEWGNL